MERDDTLPIICIATIMLRAMKQRLPLVYVSHGYATTILNLGLLEDFLHKEQTSESTDMTLFSILLELSLDPGWW